MQVVLLILISFTGFNEANLVRVSRRDSKVESEKVRTSCQETISENRGILYPWSCTYLVKVAEGYQFQLKIGAVVGKKATCQDLKPYIRIRKWNKKITNICESNEVVYAGTPSSSDQTYTVKLRSPQSNMSLPIRFLFMKKLITCGEEVRTEEHQMQFKRTTMDGNCSIALPERAKLVIHPFSQDSEIVTYILNRTVNGAIQVDRMQVSSTDQEFYIPDATGANLSLDHPSSLKFSVIFDNHEKLEEYRCRARWAKLKPHQIDQICSSDRQI